MGPLSIPAENTGGNSGGSKLEFPYIPAENMGGYFWRTVPILGWFYRKLLIFDPVIRNMPEITGIYTGFNVPINTGECEI
jgi:hypothetical protein